LADQTFRLTNGLTVELVTGPCGDEPALVVLFGVGVDHDPPGRSGMAHVLEHVLSSRASTEGAERLIEVGSEHTAYSVVAPRDRLLHELDEAAGRMAALELTGADLDRARAAVLESIARRSGGDAAATAMSYAAEAVQPARGHGRRGGIAAEVQAIELAELEAFWQAHFKPSNARLIVVGSYDAAAVRRRIESAFGPLPAGSPPVLRDPADSTVTGTLVMGDAPAAVAVAVPAPALSEPLYPAFLILAARLASASSRGTWESRFDPLARPETLFVTGPLSPGERPEPAAARLRAEVAAITARPLAPADVGAAQARFGPFLGLHADDPATCASDPRAFAYARARRAQLDTSRLAGALEATTPEQLEQAAALFAPRHTAAVIAGGEIR
jgi:zinc protease